MMEYRRKNKSRRGTAIVETALILPLLLLLTFGGIKYGWLFIKWQQTTNVARHAVRYAIRPTINSADAVDLIDDLMPKVGMDTYTPSVTYGGDDYPPNDEHGGQPVGDTVTVRIDVPVASIDILKMPLLLPTPTTLTARMTMSKEGP